MDCNKLKQQCEQIKHQDFRVAKLAHLAFVQTNENKAKHKKQVTIIEQEQIVVAYQTSNHFIYHCDFSRQSTLGMLLLLFLILIPLPEDQFAFFLPIFA